MILSIHIFACTSDLKNQNYIGGLTESIHIEHDSIQIVNDKNLSPRNVIIEHDGFKLFNFQNNALYDLDSTMQIGGKRIQRGDGPSEIPFPSSSFVASSNNFALLVIGSSYDYHLFGSTFNRTLTTLIDWKSDISPKVLSKNPIPDNPKQYNTTRILPIVNEEVLIPVVSPLKIYSPYNSTLNDYIKEAYLLAKLDVETGEFVKMVGHYPQEYVNKAIVRDFLWYWFDQSSDGYFYLSFMADSLIFKYNSNFEVVSKFGNRGKFIGNAFDDIKGGSEASYRREYEKQINTKDFFMDVKSFHSGKIIFRSAHLGMQRKDIIQMYSPDQPHLFCYKIWI